ncbi:hypothetical protein T08_10076 [Trichinella sp. T8]|nr:hypothetical protein T08_10076 [Trichinella sp. T8]
MYKQLNKILKLDIDTKHLQVNMYAEHAIIAVDLYTVVKIQLQPVLSFTTSSPLLQFIIIREILLHGRKKKQQKKLRKAKQELKYERTKKTGRNRCEAATLLASVITVLLLFSKSAELLCNSICFAYPAVKSLEKFAKNMEEIKHKISNRNAEYQRQILKNTFKTVIPCDY